MWDLPAVLDKDPGEKHIDGVVERGLSGTLLGGPFEILPSMALYCGWSDRLPDAARTRIRDFFLKGIQERGNTENHWLMYYTGNLLAAERFHDEPRMWNGLPPRAVAAEAKRWLLGMIDRTARIGHHEYDSTGYHIEHVASWLVLQEHSQDEEIRKQARKMLTLLILDMALEFYDGAWAGGHSREGYRMNTWTRLGPIMPVQYLYFGGEFDEKRHSHGWATSSLFTSYRPPEVLSRIAWDYRPHAVRKTKAPRNIYRHVCRDAGPVRKYTYRSHSFALGTTQLGLPGPPAGPIDLVSWDLTWIAPDHQGTVVCNHPYRSPRRFSAFLWDLPQVARRTIGGGKPYLQQPDRLFGASPYERMMQHENAVIVAYDIPPEDEAPYVNLFLPRTLAWHERQGWLFADAGGFLLGLWIVGPYRWEEIKESTSSMYMVADGDLIDGWMLRVESLHAGLILEAVEKREVPDLAEYTDTRTARPPDLLQWPAGGAISLRTLSGHDLQMHYHGPHLVDGREINYDACPLYDGPGITAPLGTGRISIHREDGEMDLDFQVDPRRPLQPMRVIG